MEHSSNRKHFYDDEAVVESLRRSREAELRQFVFRSFYQRLKEHALLSTFRPTPQEWALAWGQLVEWSKMRQPSYVLNQPLALWLIGFLAAAKDQTKAPRSGYHYQYIPKDILVASWETYRQVKEAIAARFRLPGLQWLKRYFSPLESSLEDVYNEAIIALFASPPKDRRQEKATLFTYFTGIARYTSLNRLRKEERQPKIPAEQQDWEQLLRKAEHHAVAQEHDFSEVLAASHAIIAESFDFEDEGELLTQLLAKIQGNYREVIVLRYLEELSYEEISEQLGISEQNARSKVSRGIAQLRKLLELH